MPRAAAFGAVLAAALAGAGCGLATLVHDSVLGPVSPAGRIHDTAVGRDFRATHSGVRADAAGEARLRPFPRDLIRRLGSPSSFRALATGLQAFFLGAATFSDRRRQDGTAPDPARIPAAGTSAAEVVAALGPPDRWVRYDGGEAMVYRAERERRTTLNVGIPPALGFLIPVPGASNLAYRRIVRDAHGEGFVLFFDARGRLAGAVAGPQP